MQTEKAEKAFKKSLNALDGIFDFTHTFLISNHIDDKFRFPIDLAIEELFTNMIKYNGESCHDIVLSFHRHDNRLTISLIDHDVESFDITKTGDVNTTKALNERQVGGLGLHLVKKMVDDIRYEYAGRQSRIILTKNLENYNV